MLVEDSVTVREVERKLLADRGYQVETGASAVPAAAANPLLAIGASTGGPLVLTKILAGLPKGFSASIVIVQHVDVEFAPGLAEWLGQQTQLEVRLIKDGDKPEPGKVLLRRPTTILSLRKRLR